MFLMQLNKEGVLLTQKRLKELLYYFPEIGEFTWIKSGTGRKNSKCAGSLNNHGYYHIFVAGKLYKRANLAWLYTHGYLPENIIDHKNKIRTDDRICNLRHVSRQCNNRNCSIRKDNISGVKGVCWVKNKWLAYIMVDRVQKYLGYHVDFDEAVCHRLAAEQCLGWAGCDSNSPAFQYVENIVLRLC